VCLFVNMFFRQPSRVVMLTIREYSYISLLYMPYRVMLSKNLNE